MYQTFLGGMAPWHALIFMRVHGGIPSWHALLFRRAHGPIPSGHALVFMWVHRRLAKELLQLRAKTLKRDGLALGGDGELETAGLFRTGGSLR